MKNIFKLCLSFVLCLSLCDLSFLNAIVIAEARIGDNYYEKFEDAVHKAKDNDTIVVLDDAEIDTVITNEKNIKIQSEEGKKYTLTFTKMYEISDCLFKVYDELVLENINIVVSNKIMYNDLFCIKDLGKLTLNSGTSIVYEKLPNQSIYTVADPCVFDLDIGGDLIINDGVYINSIVKMINGYRSVCEIYGGEFIFQSNGLYDNIENTSELFYFYSGDLTIEGGTFYTDSNDEMIKFEKGSTHGNLVINGGFFQGSSLICGYNNTIINLNSGIFEKISDNSDSPIRIFNDTNLKIGSNFEMIGAACDIETNNYAVLDLSEVGDYDYSLYVNNGLKTLIEPPNHYIFDEQSNIVSFSDFQLDSKYYFTKNHRHKCKVINQGETIELECIGEYGECNLDGTIQLEIEVLDKTFDGKKYDGLQLESSIEDPINIVITYEKYEDDWQLFSEDIIDVGKYRAVITIGENVIYREFSILQADPEIGTITVNGTVTNEMIYSDVELVRSNDEISGTLALKPSELTIDKDEYEWFFEPDDSNYKNIEGIVQINVKELEIPDLKIYVDGKYENYIYQKFNQLKASDVTIRAEAFDEGSGINKIQYSIQNDIVAFDKITNWNDYNSELIISEDGWYVVYFKAIDNHGNEIIERSNGFLLRKKLPGIQVTIDDITLPLETENMYFTKEMDGYWTLEYNLLGESAFTEVSYSLQQSFVDADSITDWKVIKDYKKFEKSGEYVLYLKIEDELGNKKIYAQAILIYVNQPHIRMTYGNKGVGQSYNEEYENVFYTIDAISLATFKDVSFKNRYYSLQNGFVDEETIDDWKLFEGPIKIDDYGKYVLYVKVQDIFQGYKILKYGMIVRKDVPEVEVKLGDNQIKLGTTANGFEHVKGKATFTSQIKEDPAFAEAYYSLQDDFVSIKDIYDWELFDHEVVVDSPGKHVLYVKVNCTKTLENNVSFYGFSVDNDIPTARVLIDGRYYSMDANLLDIKEFIKEYANIDIFASDKMSGVEKIEYYVSDQMVDIDEISDWTVFTSDFDYAGKGICYVYTRVTDRAGNVGINCCQPFYLYQNSDKAEVVNCLNMTLKDYKSVTLSWDPLANADEYKVYKKQGDEWILIGTTKTEEYIATGLKTGQEQQFYVEGIEKVESREFVIKRTNIVTGKTVLTGTVTLDIEQVSASKFKLSWNAIDGATRYIIYRKRNKDSYKKVLTLGANDLEYTTAEMPNGNYQFIVKAGRYDSTDRVMTDSSNSVSGKVEQTKPIITLIPGSKQIEVSWKKLEGVTDYEVYRATSSSGTYKKISTTKKLSFISKSLTKGKKYYFKVCGFKTYKSGDTISYKVYTDYSSVKSAVAK